MFLVLLFFPFFMLQIRLSCVILPKRVYLPLILNVNFFQLFPFHKGSQSGRFFTPDQTLLWICISTRSQTVEVYMLDRCVNWNAMKPRLLHMLQKRSPVPQTQSVSQNCPPSTLKHQYDVGKKCSQLDLMVGTIFIYSL